MTDEQKADVHERAVKLMSEQEYAAEEVIAFHHIDCDVHAPHFVSSKAEI
jgi:hypothetical protein